VNLDAARAVATGYMSEDEISWLAEQASSHSRIVEIGSWTGRSTLALAQNTQGTVWAIDNWLGSAGDLDDIIHARGIDWAFDEFRRNLRDCSNVYVKRLDSILASTHFDPCVFDMVFIDAGHTYNAVKNDLKAWAPKLIRGGLLAGHDYTTDRDHCAGVIKAVDELYPDRRLMSPNSGERSLWWTLV